MVGIAILLVLYVGITGVITIFVNGLQGIGDSISEMWDRKKK